MDAGWSVQKLPYESLRARLLADKQILEWKTSKPARASKAKGAKR